MICKGKQKPSNFYYKKPEEERAITLTANVRKRVNIIRSGYIYVSAVKKVHYHQKTMVILFNPGIYINIFVILFTFKMTRRKMEVNEVCKAIKIKLLFMELIKTSSRCRTFGSVGNSFVKPHHNKVR